MEQKTDYPESNKLKRDAEYLLIMSGLEPSESNIICLSSLLENNNVHPKKVARVWIEEDRGKEFLCLMTLGSPGKKYFFERPTIITGSSIPQSELPPISHEGKVLPKKPAE